MVSVRQFRAISANVGTMLMLTDFGQYPRSRGSFEESRSSSAVLGTFRPRFIDVRHICSKLALAMCRAKALSGHNFRRRVPATWPVHFFSSAPSDPERKGGGVCDVPLEASRNEGREQSRNAASDLGQCCPDFLPKVGQPGNLGRTRPHVSQCRTALRPAFSKFGPSSVEIGQRWPLWANVGPTLTNSEPFSVERDNA